MKPLNKLKHVYTKLNKAVLSMEVQPLLSLKNLHDGLILYGIGFDGLYQKGAVNGKYIKFENEFGGTKLIDKVYYTTVKCYGTVYSVLYY